MGVLQSLSQTMESSGLQTFLIVSPYHKKILSTPPDVCIFIYKIYTCIAMLMYYVHYKIYTEIEI